MRLASLRLVLGSLSSSQVVVEIRRINVIEGHAVVSFRGPLSRRLAGNTFGDPHGFGSCVPCGAVGLKSPGLA